MHRLGLCLAVDPWIPISNVVQNANACETIAPWANHWRNGNNSSNSGDISDPPSTLIEVNLSARSITHSFEWFQLHHFSNQLAINTLIRNFKWQLPSWIASGCFWKRVTRTSSSLQQRNGLLLRGCWILTGQKQLIVFLLCWNLGERGEACFSQASDDWASEFRPWLFWRPFSRVGCNWSCLRTCCDP